VLKKNGTDAFKVMREKKRENFIENGDPGGFHGSDA
jgi:hypothetical protein